MCQILNEIIFGYGTIFVLDGTIMVFYTLDGSIIVMYYILDDIILVIDQFEIVMYQNLDGTILVMELTCGWMVQINAYDFTLCRYACIQV